MAGAKDVRAAGERIEGLLGELTGPARETAEELVRALVELYGGGLAKILELSGPDTSHKLAGDPLVSALLVIHDLHPLSTMERVAGALDRVRPYLGSHAGGVEILGLTDGVLSLSLQGNCSGCPSSQLTATMAIERAVLEDAPEIVEVTVEGVVAEQGPQLLQIHPYQGKECAVPEKATR